MEKFSRWLSPIVFLFFATAIGVTASSTIGTSITTGGDLDVTGTATVGALTIGATPFDPAGYVLLAGDEDGQTIQGWTGADQARVDIGVNDSQTVILWGAGATPGYMNATSDSAGIFSGDGTANFYVTSNYAEVNSNTGPFSLTVGSLNVVSSQTPPTNANDPCTAGDTIDTASFHYYCAATDTWVRVAMATW